VIVLCNAVRLVAYACAAYLYLQLLGFGLTRLLLGQRIMSCQVWLAPWFGLMLAIPVLFCLSQLGMSADRAFYVITAIGTLNIVICLVRRIPLWAGSGEFDWWMATGAVATLAIAIYPMLFLSNAPTTISLGNNDPALYAVAADYLRSHSVAHLPAIDALYPNTVLVDYLLSPGHRPGAFLALSLFDALFHAPSYRVFSVVLAVLLALTTALVAIFAQLVSGNRLCGKVALALTFANVNFIYCYYHGFAAQTLVLGCIIASFILVAVDEHEKLPPISHSIAVGFAMIAMIMLVPEGAVFFILPYALFIAMRAASRVCSPREWVGRYGPAVAVVMIAGILPLWEGALWLHHISALQFGWRIPNWALPIHMLGLMSAVGRPHSILLTGGLSIPILAAIGWGLGRARDRLLIVALIVFNVAVLLYFGAVRAYSYAYYKAGVMAAFVFIAAFSAGLPRELYRYAGATCAVLVVVSFIMCRPTISEMRHLPLAVRPGLSALGEIPPAITRGQVISLERLKLWDRLWASDFMPDTAVTAHGTFFTPRTSTLTLVPRRLGDSEITVPGASDVLWASNQFILLKAQPPRSAPTRRASLPEESTNSRPRQ
jgi:hypothetical protein